MTTPTAGIVLAGGRSSRMGLDKSLLPFGGESLLARVVRRAATVCRPVIVVARAARDYPDCGASVVGDRWPGEGPLGALITGLSAVETAYAVAMACDLPFVEPALLAELVARSPGWDVVVPVVHGRAQVVCAVYRRAIAPAAESLLLRDGARSLQKLLVSPDLRVLSVPEDELRAIDPELRSFFNINTREDYEQACRLASLASEETGWTS